MRAELGLPSVKGDDELGGGMTGGFGGSMGGVRGEGKAKRPISVKFEIPYFTTSGIQVRYLKIIEPKVCDVEPFILHRECETYVLRRLLTFIVASIPFPTMGAIYHTIGRHRGPLTRRAVNKRFTNSPGMFWNLDVLQNHPPCERSPTIGETVMPVCKERQRGRCLALAEIPPRVGFSKHRWLCR